MKREIVCALALMVLCTFALPGLSHAESYTIKIVASGLNKPTGLAIDDGVLYFTEVLASPKA